MSRKLTKNEIKLLEQLRVDDELNGRGLIRQFIIVNTYEPKYKVGDYVKITCDCHEYIWGNRVVEVNAQIKEIRYWVRDKDKEFVQYICKAKDNFGYEHHLCAEESIHGYYQDRHIDGLSNTDQNTFEKKDKYSQSCSM